MDENFRAKLAAAITAALEAGLFYERDVERAVVEQCAADDRFTGECVGTFALPVDWDRQRAMRTDVEERVSGAPRGTWALFDCSLHCAQPFWKAVISDGSGKLAVGGGNDTYDHPPTFAEVYRRMLSFEIYLVRQQLVLKQTLEQDREAATRHSLRPGRIFKNLQIGSTRYSTAQVTMVDDATGTVTLHLTRRGSARRCTFSIGAAALSRAAARATSATPLGL